MITAASTDLAQQQNSREKVPELLRQLYAIVTELESLFPGRSFTPDGHLVGSIGEVMAAHDYELELLDSSTETHDAKRGDLQIQIKATQCNSVALYAKPEHLLVLKLLPDGTSRTIYNGPGDKMWEKCGKVQKNGQRSIALSTLAKIMESVPENQRLPKVR